MSRVALRLRLSLLALLADCLSIEAAFGLADMLRSHEPGNGRGLIVGTIMVPVYLGVAISNGAFTYDALERKGAALDRAFSALLIAATMVIFIAFYLRSAADVSRLVFAVGTAGSAAAIALSRLSIMRAARRRFGGPLIRLILIEDGAQGPPLPGADVLRAAEHGLSPDGRDPFARDRLGRILRSADRVIVAAEPDRREQWAIALKGCNVDGALFLPELAALGAIGHGPHAGEATVRVSAGPLGWRDRALKRSLDIIAASLALIVLAPLLLLTALAILCDSRGPILFHQIRLGRSNCLFRIFKFRSMRAERSDSDGMRSAARDDDRITRVGRIIRRTSIDELPQILNVLGGTMSLVGPRPHALASTAGGKLFWDVDHRYWQRHALKPGLTGLAQVRGYRGATDTPDDLTNRLQADLEYLSNWSIWLDMAIMMRTFRVIVHEKAF